MTKDDAEQVAGIMSKHISATITLVVELEKSRRKWRQWAWLWFGCWLAGLMVNVTTPLFRCVPGEALGADEAGHIYCTQGGWKPLGRLF